MLAVGHLAVRALVAGPPRVQWALIGLTACFLLAGHPAPFGTMAFGSLLVAALAHERGRRSGTDEA